jgi:hypothetical protein
MKPTLSVILLCGLLAATSTSVFASDNQPPITSRAGEVLLSQAQSLSSAIIVMPVVDKSGHTGMQGNAFSEFTTEVLNQAVRNTGVKTLAWFKVSKALEEEVYGISDQKNKSASPFKMVLSPGLKQDLTSDLYITEMIQAAKRLKAKYIVRPVILKLFTSSKVETEAPTCLPIFGCVNKGKSDLFVFGEADIKIDIISTSQEDIVASRTFSGRSVDVTKDRANRIDAVVGSQYFKSESEICATGRDKDICNEGKLKVALYDTVDKVVEFIGNKVN